MATRDTRYAREITSGILPLPDGSEARIERLFVKKENQDEVRLSWWRDGKMVVRPLDLPENDLISLIAKGITTGVFTSDGVAKLNSIFAKAHIEALIEAGIASGESSEWTKNDLEAMKAEIRARHAQRQGQPQ